LPAKLAAAGELVPPSSEINPAQQSVAVVQSIPLHPDPRIPPKSQLAAAQQSVAVVDAGKAALLWAYARPFYLTPAMLSTVPTAVVTPIKREAPPDGAPPPVAVAPPTAAVTTPTAAPRSAHKAHLPPFETFRAPPAISTAAAAGSGSSVTSSMTSSASGDAAVNLSGVHAQNAVSLTVAVLQLLYFLRSIVLSVSVCACVCLSVRHHIFGTTRPIFTKFVCAYYLWPWLGPPPTA